MEPGRSALKMRKFQTAVYPPRMARTAAKLWENAFRTIPDISFFDAEQNFVGKQISKKIPAQNQLVDILEELRWFERHWQMRLEKLLPVVHLFSLYDPW